MLATNKTPARRYCAPVDPIAVSVPTACAMIGVSRSRIYEMLKNKEIEGVKLGASRLIKVASLRRLIDGEAA